MAIKSKTKVYHNNLTNKAIYNVNTISYDYFAQDPYECMPQVFDTLLKNVGPGSHFFFFTSLANYHGPWASKLPSVLNWNTRLNDMTAQEGLNYKEKMQSILQLIHGFKIFEANNEYTYFKQSIEPLLANNPELYKLFDDTFKDHQIDYPRFIALVTSLDQDIKTIQTEISDLTNHTKKWDEAYKTAFQYVKKLHAQEYNKYGNDELFNNAFRKEITDKAREEIQFNTSKIEQQLAHGLIDIKKVMSDAAVNKDLMDKLSRIGMRMLLNNQTELSKEEIKDQLGGSRLQKQHLLAFYRELKRMAITYDTSIEKFYTGLKEAMEYYQMFPTANAGIHTNSGLPTYLSSNNKKLIDDLTKFLLVLVKNDTVALSQYEALLKKANGKNKLNPRKNQGGESTEQWAGLIKRRRKLIIEALKQLPHTEKRDAAISQLSALEADKESGGGIIHLENSKGEIFDIRKKSHFNAYIELIKQALNMQEKSGLTSIIDKLEIILKSSEAYDRQEIITITSEHGDALELARILPNAITTVLNNNFREDSVHIGYLNYSSDNTQALNNITANINEINDALKTTSKTMNKLRTKDIYKNLSKKNIANGRQSREYNVQDTLQVSKDIDIQTAQKLRQELNIDQLEQIIPILKNLFVVEQSDKFSTTFNSVEHGFKGGSLGADVEKQVQNINEMLNLGGITPIDADFLVSAIMNAGPGMLGYGQKDKIETYLSSIASVCMFTSGAQSIEEYANSILEQAEQSISTTKIHIFKLGTLTIPLSYILELMEKGLTKCFTLLDTTFQLENNAGNKVTINNPVNEASDKISTCYYLNGKFFTIGDWQATAEAGLPKVNLDMAILGSYLDVLDSVNAILNNII